jgi:2-phospho-L-lactate transferase/gluconeogenesis factor (CofD/UPF0052 family)
VPHDIDGLAHIRVVLFSGGRGSGALTTTLVRTRGVLLTVAINGYDDGASTGEVRRFLGDVLGPSDFRKNASRLATELATCPPSLIALLDRRLPDDASAGTVQALIEDLTRTVPGDAALREIPGDTRDAVARRLARFGEELNSGRAFSFRDCSVGNLVFAGTYLGLGRRFNDAVDDYAGLAGLSAGLIENVTDGTNAHLVALDLDGHVLGREADIVDANRQNRIHDIYLRTSPLDGDKCRDLAALGPERAAASLEAESVHPLLNPRLQRKIAEADLIVYAPGTQHSSLFPSYLTHGLSAALAANARAIKLLITNIQSDAEIAGSSAVDIIERAVFYLKEKGRLATPTPALVTHYLVNDPVPRQARDTPGASKGTASDDRETYVPLGRLDALQDPRLVRVGDYEHGGSGRHDASKVLAPYVAGLLARRRERHRVAVLLYDAGSTDKLAQTLLEMVRGGAGEQPVELVVFCETTHSLDREFLATLPFTVREVGPLDDRAEDARLRRSLKDGGFEYVLLFESSGMYSGEDIPWLLSHLTGRLDAVWGSRRLSVRDIEESYRLKYRKHGVLGAVSYAGSHALSLAYLLLYGRYVSDTLSAARAIRTADVLAAPVALTHKDVNQYLLSDLLRRKAEMFEVPVHFYSLSPDKVRRTTVRDGVRAVGTILWRRLKRMDSSRLAEQSGARSPEPGARMGREHADDAPPAG